MRSIILTVCAVLFYTAGHAQLSDYVTIIIEKDADKAAAEVVEKEKALNPGMSAAAQKFTADTVRINYIWKRKLEFLPDRDGKIMFARDAVNAYKRLMTDWYDYIMKKLNEKDKAELVEVQKEWNAYYEETDKKYPDDKYDAIAVYAYKASLMKQRAVQMFQYAQMLK